MSDTQTIKEKLDIVEFINEYVQLKPAGINHKGLCPFHSEKTPSFMVSRDRQSWHCFGCGKGGDIFSFAQEIEGMEFFEALQLLANRAGITLERRAGDQGETTKKTRLKDLNREAARFFHKFLLDMPAAETARVYLRNRGLRQETIESWQIGYIPDQWDLLTQYLLKKGFGIDDLVDAGLTIRRDAGSTGRGSGMYDRFRGRIMFPIRDVHGTVVGFTGRVLVETEHSGGKYVNTPQTALYDKSRVVFGLDRAKQSARAKDVLVLVEGQVDVISAHQTGMDNVAATSGTALTEQQVALISRYTKNLRMAFDSDEAGIKAAKRGIDLALSNGMSVKVIHIPDGAGKDPDECIQKNPEIWSYAVEHAEDVMQWYIERTLKRYNLNDIHQKQRAINEILAEIARIPYAVERDHWIGITARESETDHAVLTDEIKRIGSVNAPSGNGPGGQDRTPAKARPPLAVLVERLMALMIQYPESILPVWGAVQRIEPTLSTSEYAALYEYLKKQYTTAQSLSADHLKLSERHDGLQDGLQEQISILRMRAGLDFSDASQAELTKNATELIDRIADMSGRSERARLERAIREAEKKGDREKLMELIGQFQSLQEH